MQRKENEFIYDMIRDEGYLRTGKYRKEFGVQFGGSRGSGGGKWGPEAFDAAANPLTWIIRNTTVHAEAEQNMDGIVTINTLLTPMKSLTCALVTASFGIMQLLLQPDLFIMIY